MRAALSIDLRHANTAAIMRTNIAQLELNGLAAASEARNGGTHPSDRENKIGLAGSNPSIKAMNALPDGESFFLLPEVAGALRVSVKTIRRLIGEGKLKTHKIRGRILIRRAELMAYVNAVAR
jgi:excisionase family DNA binding protein